MAKVILLSGSPNINGNTIQVFKKMAEIIEAKGVEAEVLSLAGLNIADCMCPAKIKNEDGFDLLVAKIKDAEGLIVGGPVYWGTMRGELMVALQRLAMASAQDNNFLAGKIGGPVAIGRRGGQTSSIQEALMFYLYHDMIVPGSTYWNIVFGKAPGEAIKDEEGMRTVIHFAENVANLIKKVYVQ
ncbi:MAG: flavodoxin family protein [Bacteroidaceae bacterium]|nr:flavodoxin family protein [Bacteroidaceae bacterium]